LAGENWIGEEVKLLSRPKAGKKTEKRKKNLRYRREDDMKTSIFNQNTVNSSSY